MEVQDKKELARQKKEAIKLFTATFEKGQPVVHEDPKIQKAVQKSLDQYAKTIKKDMDFFGKNLVKEVESIYTNYLSVLNLAIALADAAEADKKINHASFLKNAWIKALRESEELKKETLRLHAGWDKQSDQVKLWLRDVVKHDDEYMAYLDRKSPSVEDQKQLINHLFRKIILGKTIINDYYEEEILRWAEDHEIIKGMVDKTVKSFSPEEDRTLMLYSLSLNWEDDLQFIEKLYKGAASLPQEFHNLIAENTRNWEVDRLPLTDRAILEMAITEMMTFPGIPVKVTINEYIELAKGYSTPKSRQFINGILDVIAKELQTRGVVKKSGRGLMDNK
jgi:transcription antitermination protein NusB